MVTSSEMNSRREKGLCYNCDEKYTLGHKCKDRVYYMEINEEEEICCLEEGGVEVLGDTSLEEAEISLNALTGGDGITTMKLGGVYKGQNLDILFDTGSTLSFCEGIHFTKTGLLN